MVMSQRHLPGLFKVKLGPGQLLEQTSMAVHSQLQLQLKFIQAAFPPALGAHAHTHTHTKKNLTVKLLEDQSQEWRDDSVVENTDFSFRGLGFNSQRPHGSSQSSITPFPGDPAPS